MKLFNLFIVTAIASTIVAADQSTVLAVQDDFAPQAKVSKTFDKDLLAANYSDLLPTPTYVTYPPKPEKINLSQLFATDTGHPEVDDRAAELTHLLLSSEEKIKAFRTLPMDLQTQSAVDVFMLSCKFTIDNEEFKKRCDALLAGTITSLVSPIDSTVTLVQGPTGAETDDK